MSQKKTTKEITKKTTKEILAQKVEKEGRIPLYNPEALQKIREEMEQWKSTVVREEDRNNWYVTPSTVLGSQIPRGMLYTPLDNADLDYLRDLGFSGKEPYTRAIHANLYRGRRFTIRQLAGFGGPEDTNKRIRFLLDHGATGVSIIFDLPTIQEYDSDDPMSKGQVGMCGVAIDCVDDMATLFEEVPLDKVTVSLVSHYPTNTAILFPMYLEMATRRGIDWSKLTGSVQNDLILECVVRSAVEYIPPRDCFKIQCDNMEFTRKNVPGWNLVTFNGYNLRENGTSAITEMAVATANAIESLEEMVRRGHDVDWVAERIAFFWSPSNDFFEEAARIRAMRRLWYQIMKHRFDAKNPRALWMRCHVQTSGISLFREEPYNNIVRAAYQGLASVLGGAQSMHIDSYDEAYSVPTEEAALVSLRTQQIIQAETAVTEVVDPLGGSFYVEALTDEIEERILDEVTEIEEMGGLVSAVEKGWLHKKVAKYAIEEQKEIEEGKISIVGHNYLRASDLELPEINVFRYPEGVEERQQEKLRKLRQKRDSRRVEGCLSQLREACQKGENIVPYCLEAAKADATEGEMFQVFKEAFGLWKPPVYW